MCCFPILILTSKDRVRYLDTTISSIKATVPDNVPIFVFSNNESDLMIKYLTTNSVIDINNYLFPNDLLDWKYRIGFIPNKKTVKGIEKIIKHIRTSLKGTTGIEYALKYIFGLDQNISHVIYLEDDVIFKAGWYEKMVRHLRENANIGILSGFRYLVWAKKYHAINADIQKITSGGIGAVCWGIKRELTNIIWKSSDSFLAYDDFIIKICRSVNLDVCFLTQGVCQHIGIKSSIYKECINSSKQDKYSRSFFNSDGSLSRIDLEIEKPFMICNATNVIMI